MGPRGVGLTSRVWSAAVVKYVDVSLQRRDLAHALTRLDVGHHSRVRDFRDQSCDPTTHRGAGDTFRPSSEIHGSLASTPTQARAVARVAGVARGLRRGVAGMAKPKARRGVGNPQDAPAVPLQSGRSAVAHGLATRADSPEREAYAWPRGVASGKARCSVPAWDLPHAEVAPVQGWRVATPGRIQLCSREHVVIAANA